MTEMILIDKAKVRQALEAMESFQKGTNGLYEREFQEEIDVLRTAIEKAETVQGQEPVRTTGEANVELDFYSDDASNGQQRQLVGEVEMGQLVGDGPHESAGNPDAEGAVAVIRGVDEYGPMLGWHKHWINFPVGTQFYTTPPAAQPALKPLTDEQKRDLVTNWFAEGWAIKAAHGMLDDYDTWMRKKNGGKA